MTSAVATTQDVADQILHLSSPPTYEFGFDEFLKREYRFGLDRDRPSCKAYMQGHCPMGPNCPDKHHTQSSFNKYARRSMSPKPTPLTSVPSLVCKHWLRGLCKKGEHCEFLHEYNLRRMPECNYFARHQTCPNGDDCLYLHIDPDFKRPACPHFERGFCPLGPRCANRHVKMEKLCPFYIAGFCPNGKQCPEGHHAKFVDGLPPPEPKVIKSKEQLEQEKLIREQELREEEERERERYDKGADPSSQQQRFRANWRSKPGKAGIPRQRRGRGF